jgi:hypothetical protein
MTNDNDGLGFLCERGANGFLGDCRERMEIICKKQVIFLIKRKMKIK